MDKINLHHRIKTIPDRGINNDQQALVKEITDEFGERKLWGRYNKYVNVLGVARVRAIFSISKKKTRPVKHFWWLIKETGKLKKE